MSMDYDEARWEDMEMEAQQDRWYEMIDTEIENQRLDDLVESVKDGYRHCEDIIGEVIYEIDKLDINRHPQSYVFLNLSLLEIVERDVIFFPLLFSHKNLLNDQEGKVNNLIRESVGKNANTSAFVCRLYQHGENDFTQAKVKIDSSLSLHVPNHKLLKPQNNSTKYREMITTYRNAIIHGKDFATPKEAEFISEFIHIWREKIFNPILHKYGAEFDQGWKLI